jgi:hypothetical protein
MELRRPFRSKLYHNAQSTLIGLEGFNLSAMSFGHGFYQCQSESAAAGVAVSGCVRSMKTLEQG